jgi:hypothetical protein
MESGLLERDTELAALDAAGAPAERGAGSVVLVAGYAGLGKTSVVRAFLRMVSGRVRVLAGRATTCSPPGCWTRRGPRPGLPVGRWPTRRPAGTATRVLTAVRDVLLAPGRPTVLVIEDVHWADEVTLDVLWIVGRRVADLPAVLVMTYRDDEVGPDHPLHRVLGGLRGPHVRRLALERCREQQWRAPPVGRCRARRRSPAATRSSSPRFR